VGFCRSLFGGILEEGKFPVRCLQSVEDNLTVKFLCFYPLFFEIFGQKNPKNPPNRPILRGSFFGVCQKNSILGGFLGFGRIRNFGDFRGVKLREREYFGNRGFYQSGGGSLN
jgi:hypothetical protein